MWKVNVLLRSVALLPPTLAAPFARQKLYLKKRFWPNWPTPRSKQVCERRWTFIQNGRTFRYLYRTCVQDEHELDLLTWIRLKFYMAADLFLFGKWKRTVHLCRQALQLCCKMLAFSEFASSWLSELFTNLRRDWSARNWSDARWKNQIFRFPWFLAPYILMMPCHEKLNGAAFHWKQE